MLVEHPHDLAGIHCAAAAQGNDHIRLEQTHLLGACLRAGKCGIRSHVKECGVLNSHLIQLIGNRLGVAVLIKEIVSDDKGLLLAHHMFELVQRNRQAALLDIHLLRCPEPQHVLSPLSHSLDIQQVLHSHVLRYGVSAPAAAAQCE